MSRKAGSKHRSKEEKAKTRLEIVQEYLAGKTQTEIAEKLGYHQTLISLDLKAIREEYKSHYLSDWEEAKSRELARLDKLEAHYWEAWERSKRDRSERKQFIQGATDSAGRPLPSEITVEIEERDGNPEFLRGVERCIEMRCKILGLFTPAPTIHNNLIQLNNSENVAEKKVVFYLPSKDPDPREEVTIIEQ